MPFQWQKEAIARIANETKIQNEITRRFEYYDSKNFLFEKDRILNYVNEYLRLLKNDPDILGIYDAHKDLIYSDMIFEGYKDNTSISKKARWANILAHERIHRRKRNCKIKTDIPTATAIGYLEEVKIFSVNNKEDFIPTFIIHSLENQSYENVEKRVNNIMSKYRSSIKESLQSYEDGLQLFSMVYNESKTMHHRLNQRLNSQRKSTLKARFFSKTFVKGCKHPNLMNYFDMTRTFLEALCQGADYAVAEYARKFHVAHNYAEPKIMESQEKYQEFLTTTKDLILDFCTEKLGIKEQQTIGFVLTNTLDKIEEELIGEPSGLNPF